MSKKLNLKITKKKKMEMLEYRILAYIFITIVTWLLLKPILKNSRYIYNSSIFAELYKISIMVLIFILACNIGDIFYNWGFIYSLVSLSFSTMCILYCIIYLIINNTIQTIFTNDSE